MKRSAPATIERTPPVHKPFERLPSLSTQQQQVVDAIAASKRSAFLTGAPGTGKTVCLQYLRRIFREQRKHVQTVGTTGISACPIGGRTIHSFFGIGIVLTEKTLSASVAKILANPARLDAMKRLDIVILEEVSMLQPSLFKAVDELLRRVRGNPNPFGGVRFILVGDFFQLAPVDPGKPTTFAFECETWKTLDPEFYEVTRNYRQNDGVSLSTIHYFVQRLMTGTFTQEDTDRLNRFRHSGAKVSLYTTNAAKDEMNKEMLAALYMPIKTFMARDSYTTETNKFLLKNILSPERLEIAKGARVIITRNLFLEVWTDKPKPHPAKKIKLPLFGANAIETFSVNNGDVGIVRGFDADGVPLVALDRGCGRIVVRVPRVTWDIMDANETVLASRSQHPLMLGWTMTVWKAQGMTIDSGAIVFGGEGSAGLVLTALSRFRSSSELRITGLTLDMVTRFEPERKRVAEFYKKAREKMRRGCGGAGGGDD